eukprot:561307-Pelagomonas_calceolata.AAC.1
MGFNPSTSRFGCSAFCCKPNESEHEKKKDHMRRDKQRKLSLRSGYRKKKASSHNGKKRYDNTVHGDCQARREPRYWKSEIRVTRGWPTARESG